MKKTSIISKRKRAIGLSLLAALVSAMLITGCTTKLDPTDPDTSNSEEPISKAQFSWVVEPKFEYDSIGFELLGYHYIIKDDPASGSLLAYKLNTETGEVLSDKIPYPATEGPPRFVYDPIKKKYGITNIPGIDVFDDLNSMLAGHYNANITLFPVTQIEIIVDGTYLENLEETTYSYSHPYPNEKFALANRQGSVTDFIYDGYDQAYSTQTNSLAMMKDGKWGFVDATGKYVIDPVFDDAISIDNDHAFVKQNGKWGIIRKEV
ncbi:MAG: WG repeat-containing protein [Peptococcaceae bacterium]|nr:WG repeat-containing protein [Peptococcaceae bacterium]